MHRIAFLLVFGASLVMAQEESFAPDPAVTPDPVATPATAASPATAPATAPAAAPAAGGDGARGMSGMSILGNEETPKSLVIVPWKSSRLGDEPGVENALDERPRPLDREVFMRELRYYALQTGSE